MNIRQYLTSLFSDRATVFVQIALGLIVITAAVVIAFQIHPSELNIPVRYTTYGTTNIYADSWYYLASFVVFLIAIFALHVALTAKLSRVKGTQIGQFFMAITTIVVIISLFWIGSILGVATLLQ